MTMSKAVLVTVNSTVGDDVQHDTAAAVVESAAAAETTRSTRNPALSNMIGWVVDDDNTSSSSSIITFHCNYRCIYCLQPCNALYRRLGTKVTNSNRRTTGSSSVDIQLVSCHYCCNPAINVVVVDPYCERELLLVILDVLLFRIYAVRHLLFNRFQLSLSLQNEGEEYSDTDRIHHCQQHYQLEQRRIRHVIFLLIVSVVLRSHICIISTSSHDNTNMNHLDSDGMIVMTVVAYKWMKYTLQSLVLYTVQILCAITLCFGILAIYQHTTTIQQPNSSTRSTTSRNGSILPTLPRESIQYISFSCCLAILYPALGMTICTSIIHIWENSIMVRRIGSGVFFVAHQIIFVFQVIQMMVTTIMTARQK